MKKILTLFSIAFSLQLPAQNVGIGITIPLEKLHVAGNIKTDTIKPNAMLLTPNAGLGKVLTSDIAGNASWQNNIVAPGNTGFGVWGDCATNGNISEYNPVADTPGDSLAFFGHSVAVSGNYAIVGAYQDDIGAGNDQGSASFYKYNGGTWVFMQKITDVTGAANDFFGYSVSISGNYAIVSALQDDIGANTDQGSVSIYQFNGSSWVFMQKITDATGAAGDVFGTRVSISGTYAVVGATADDVGANTDQGSASIYRYNGSSWVLMQKITDASGAAGDFFGFSVSISGNYVAIGIPFDDVGANANQGSESIYQYNGSNWVFMQKITDPSGDVNDNFGYSVAVSGNCTVAGAYADDGNNADQGSASIYQYSGSNWTLMQKITDGSGAAGDFFGFSVSISGNYIILGAPEDKIGINTGQGSASIYLRVGLGWQKLQYVTDPAGYNGDSFGNVVAIDGSTKIFLIGAESYATGSGKVVFGKIN
ncbi:MAG TPA: hypothetical protein VGO58_19850 [Chitinophagaceae bacterium]|jgi:hypothetical protein|nr:hypothetical protein [Chitinophagaceae bacterium]